MRFAVAISLLCVCSLAVRPSTLESPAHDDIKPAPASHGSLADLGVGANTSRGGWWVQSSAPGKHKHKSSFVGTPPVHEFITYKALKNVGQDVPASHLREGPDFEAPPADLNDFIRGACWNDDPLSLLFDAGKLWSKTTGTVFANRMEGLTFTWTSQCRGGEKGWEKEHIDWPNHLMCHSHYGELQFFHGMDKDGRSPADTQSKILAWAEWAWSIAMSEVHGSGYENIPIPQSGNGMDADNRALLMRVLKSVVPDSEWIKPGFTARYLFTNEDGILPDATKVTRYPGRVAVASLVHMIADSMAAGHSGRRTKGDHLGEIFQFRGYTTQDHGLHSDYDMFPFQNTDGNNWKEQGGMDNREYRSKQLALDSAIMAGTELLRLYFAQAGWTQGPKQLFERLFTLEPNAVASGNGQVTYKFYPSVGTAGVSSCQVCFYAGPGYSGTPQCTKKKEPCNGEFTEADYGCRNVQLKVQKDVGLPVTLRVYWVSQVDGICDESVNFE